MNLKKSILTNILLIFSVLLTSCSKESPEDQKIVVSALLPLSGDLAFLGEPGRKALEIASEQLESEQIPLQFEFHDTKANPKEAVTILQREKEVNNRKIFLVTLSGPSLAVREALTGTDSLMLSVAIHPDLPSTNAPIVRFCPSAAQEAQLLLDEITKSPEPVALVVSRDAATTFQVNQYILPGLKTSEQPVSFVEWFDVGNKDFKNLTARLTSTPTSRIILLGYGSDFPAALAAIQQARGSASTELYGGIGFVEMESKPTGMDAIEINAVVPAFCVDEALSGSAEFREKYKAKAGKVAPYDAAFTYDAAMTIGNIIKDGTSAPSDILGALRGNTVVGVTGRIEIGNDGEATTDLRWASLSSEGLSEKTK